jgi:putative DNA primase/helicase
MPADNKTDLEAIKSAIADDAEAVLSALFGDPTTRTRREWRWGQRGSVSYRFDRRMFWCFETDTGGSLLDAIMHAHGCSLHAAIMWAKDWLGLDGVRPAKARDTSAPPRLAYDADAEQQIALAEALALWRAGRGTHSTAAARYLQARAIDRWPGDSVRMIGAGDVARLATSAPDQEGGKRKPWSWWRWPALVFPLTNDAGDVTAVQLIALEDDGRAAPHWEHGGKIKMMRGVAVGSVLRLPGDPAGPLAIAEGGETALSVWLATGHDTFATMGSVARAPLEGVPKERLLVVCRDDDPPKSPAFVASRNAVRAWRKAKRTVVEATPWAMPRHDKSDFADVLAEKGTGAVLARLDAAIAPLLAVQEERPSVEAAREGLRRDMAAAVAQLLAWRDDGQSPAPFLAGVVDVGIGKTELALAEAALKAYRAGRKPVYTTPTHALNDELVGRLEAMAKEQNLSPLIAVYRGAEAQDPANPGKTMCTELALYSSATAAHVSPLESVCKVCPSRDSCGFQRQQGMVADIWFAAVDVIFRAAPKPLRDVDFLIIDEGFVARGLFGIGAPLQLVDRSRFDASSDIQIQHGSGRIGDTADLIQELRQFRRALGKLLDAGGIGPLERQAIAGAGLNREKCQQAVSLEWKRFRQVPRGELDADQTDSFLRGAATNANVKLMVRLWSALADLAADDGPDRSGRVSRWASDNGKTPDCFRVVGCERIDKAWRVPTLHIDASADMSLIRERVGSRAKLAASATAATPYMRVTQLTGTFGKGALLEATGRHLERIWSWTLATARETGGQWLVVANKAVVAKLAEMGPPDFVKLAHFNALRGLDAYGRVRGIVVLGRPMPAPGAVETLRGAVTGRATPHALAGQYYPLATTTIRGRDGSAVSVNAESHPDALVDALLRSISDAEVIQAIGRGRGVNRDADRPLSVYLLGNAPLKAMQPDHVEQWEPLGADREHFARVGIELESAADMARLMGEPDRKKIEKARSRGQMPTNAYDRYSIGNVGIWNSGTRVGAYQVKQPRKSASLRYARLSADAGALLPHLQKIFPASAITAVHDPWASGLGVVQCQQTGQLNFGLAPINVN